MTEIVLFAHSKINLSLDLLEKRSDGYHEISTVMQCVSLSDEVRVSLAETPGIEVTALNRDLPSDMRNTARKAAVMFLQSNDLPDTGINIELKKIVPTGAGLGGGSADAAAVLIALNMLLETNLTNSELAEIGASVGSDVPFCVAGGAAHATGRGEILRPLPCMPDCAIVVVKPRFSLSTARMYAQYAQSEITRRPDTDALLTALAGGGIAEISANLGNVFEQVLTTWRAREIKKIRKSLTKFGALGSSMTGSGSAVFGIFSDNERAVTAKNTLCRRYRDCFLARPVAAGDMWTPLLVK